MKKEKLGLKGSIRLKHTRGGRVILDKTISNILVNAGFAEAAGLLNGEEATGPFTYLAIGIGTTGPAVGNTILESEITTGGGARASATCSRVTTAVTNDTAQMLKEWTFSAGFAVTESGAFNHGTPGSGQMLARQTFTAVPVISGDKFEVTWKIQCS